IFGCIKGDKMDVVQRCDDVWHLVTTHLPGYQVKLYWLRLIHIAQQFEGGRGLVSVPRTASRNRGKQKVFCTQGTLQRARHRLPQAQLLHEKRGQGSMRQVPWVDGASAVPLRA